MKKTLSVFIFFSFCEVACSQELNTAKAIDSVIRKIHWKMVKKMKSDQPKKNLYEKDKESDKNYRYLIHRPEKEATACVFYNDQLIMIKQFSKYLPGDNEVNVSTFFLYKDQVISKIVKGREVSPIPLIDFAEQHKEEAKNIIFKDK